jgi:hypothetical protein
VKCLSPSLLALALGAAVPVASAVDVSDSDLKLGLVLQLQTRAEVASAQDTLGDDYSLEANGAGDSDTADFYIRRFRPGFKGTYQEVWKFGAIMRLDDSERAGKTAVAASIHQGWIAREFKDEAFTQTVKMGLDYAFFNHAEASNSETLFPLQRASAALYPVRGTGISYMLNTANVRWGVDIQNNIADDNAIQVEAPNNSGDGEGLSYTTRVELTGFGLGEPLPKWQETWCGKEGFGWIFGFEAGKNMDDRTLAGADGESIDTTCFGADLVVRYNQLSAMIEGRWLTREFDLDTGGDVDDLDQETLSFQVGYAIPFERVTFEPGIRYQIIDFNKDDDNERVNYNISNNRDYGNSGEQIDVVVNAYFNGHGNKLSLCYTQWSAEEGDAEANVIRLQHQLKF